MQLLRYDLGPFMFLLIFKGFTSVILPRMSTLFKKLLACFG